MKKILLLFAVLGIVRLVHGQSIITHTDPHGLTVKSYEARAGGVDSIVVISASFHLVWRDAPIMEQEDCHLIGDLVGTCAILELPFIGSIEYLDSNVVMLFGGCRNDALRDRQLILIDAHTGRILGWFGYITWRGNDICKMFIDLERRTLLIGARENEMEEDCLYVVDRTTMTMEALSAETSPVKALDISLLGDYRPTAVRKGYFQVAF